MTETSQAHFAIRRYRHIRRFRRALFDMTLHSSDRRPAARRLALRSGLTWLLATALLAVQAAANAAPIGQQALGCLIEPSESIELGTPVVGVVSRMLVERGDRVRKGQALVQLSSGIERAGYSAAEQRSRAQAELAGAESAEAFARRKLERTRQLHSQEFVSGVALDQAIADQEAAAAKLRQVREQLDIAAQELAMAGAQLGQRVLRSPIDGVVVERYVSRGERVEDKPLLRLVALDPLRVEVLMPAAAFQRVRVGMAATVQPDLPGVPEQPATVQLVDRTIDAASSSFRVRLLLPNPDEALPGGLRCKVAFGAAGAPAAVPAPAALTSVAPRP